MSFGAITRHGPHQFAKKSRTTTLFLNVCIASPSSVCIETTVKEHATPTFSIMLMNTVCAYKHETGDHQKGTSSHEKTHFHILIVKIGQPWQPAHLLLVEETKRTKGNSQTVIFYACAHAAT